MPKSILRRRLEWAFQPPITVAGVGQVIEDIEAPSFEEFALDIEKLSGQTVTALHSLNQLFQTVVSLAFVF